MLSPEVDAIMNHRRIKSRLGSLNTTAKSIFLCIIFVVLAVTPKVLESSQAPNQKGLTFDFFRVVHKLPSEQPEKWQSIKINDRRGSYLVYAERVASFRIPVNEIVSITLEPERTRVLKAEDLKKETSKTGPQSKKDYKLDTQQGDYVYKATFSLSKSEGRRHEEYANANEGARFDFRFGDKRLGVVQFIGSFGGAGEFTTFLKENERPKLMEIFAPIKDKVIWK